MRTIPSNRLWAAAATALVVLGTTVAPAGAAEVPVEGATPPAELLADVVPTGADEGVDPTDTRTPDEGKDSPDPSAPSDAPTDPAVPEPSDDPTDPAVPGEPTDGAPADDGAPSDDPTDPAEPGDQVVVVLPEIVPTVVDGATAYVLPDLEGVVWLVDGTPVADLVTAGAAYRLGDEQTAVVVTADGLGRAIETLVIGAVATEGHLLATDDGGTVAVRYVVDPRVPVGLVVPSAEDADGRVADVVVVGDVPGLVVRDVAGELLAPGPHAVTAEYVDGVAAVELVVEAAPGHRLEVDGAPAEALPGAGGTWPVTLTFTDLVPPVDHVVLPPAPTRPRVVAPVPPEDTLLPGPHVVTVEPAAVPEPAPVAPRVAPVAQPAATTTPAETTERLSDSGAPGGNLMVLLGLLFVGAAWLVLGVGRDSR